MYIGVSIQPKPKTGLEGEIFVKLMCFNPVVSIQPKPKTGLEDKSDTNTTSFLVGFNPAEAEDGFRR